MPIELADVKEQLDELRAIVIDSPMATEIKASAITKTVATKPVPQWEYV